MCQNREGADAVGKVDGNKKQKLNTMLDTALRLFTVKGIAKTSISDIAESSGVAKGTFYLYFKDKQDIRNKLVAYQSSKILRIAYEAMEEQTLDAIEDKIVFFVERVLDELAEKPDLLRLISKNLSWGMQKKEIFRPDIEDDFDLPALLRQMTQESGITGQDTELMLYLIVELVGASCYSVILYQVPCSMQELKPRLFAAVRQIVRQFTGGEKE